MVKECKDCTAGKCQKIKERYDAAQAAKKLGAVRFSGINWMLIDFDTKEHAQEFIELLCSQSWDGLYGDNVIWQGHEGTWGLRIR